MTNEERDIITRFVERTAGGASAGSVPAAGTNLPPVDTEADALIGVLFASHPEARYRITQMAFVQEHALAEAQNRISQLTYQLAAARQAPAPAAPRGGFFSGLFGGGSAEPWNAAPAAAAPRPTYAPGYQPGMFQRGGSGFLGSALATAAGVAGGVVMGNALMNLFSPHAANAANFAGPTPETPTPETPTPETIVNQPIHDAPSPWTDPAGTGAGPGAAPDPWSANEADPGFDPSHAGSDPTGADFDPSQGDFDPGDFSGGDFGGGDDDTIV